MYIRQLRAASRDEGLGALYVGGKPDLDTLLHYNIQAVLTVSKKPAPQEVRGHYGDWAFYKHLQDGKTLAPDSYFLASNVVVACLRAGQNTLVHCLAGRNRSCLVAALALREIFGMTGAEALGYVRSSRPNSFHNEVQANWLMGLDRD